MDRRGAALGEALAGAVPEALKRKSEAAVSPFRKCGYIFSRTDRANARKVKPRFLFVGGQMSFARTGFFIALVLSALGVSGSELHAQATPFRFRLLEATIPDVHRAIREGQLTCRGLVQAYINRAKAYNGTCNQLVTEDMASTYLPSYDEYQAAVRATADRPDSDPGKTPPIEFGRMEATASDPTVQQQFGMTVGIPNAGQVRALGMLNIRGQRSVTCKGDFDRHPSAGPLPAGAPSVCEEFRRQPDALERAEELDQQYGRNPDLAAMPMYCIPFSFKDPFDTKDMRSTGGADAAYDIDLPARDHTLVARLRETGRDHLRQGEHHRVQRARARQSGRC